MPLDRAARAWLSVQHCLPGVKTRLPGYLTYYNNYRLHSALQWQPPVTRYSSRGVTCRGLAGLPGLEPMAANPAWGESYCDPPIVVTPTTMHQAYALVVWQLPVGALVA
jgi:hypothetical protein